MELMVVANKGAGGADGRVYIPKDNGKQRTLGIYFYADRRWFRLFLSTRSLHIYGFSLPAPCLSTLLKSGFPYIKKLQFIP